MSSLNLSPIPKLPTPLSPLHLVVSYNSEGKESGSPSSQKGLISHNSSGSDIKGSFTQIRHRKHPAAPSYQGFNDAEDFYLGDIYARVNRPFDCFLSTQAELEESPGPYHEHIRRISSGWPHLRYLADFMTVSTLPLRFKDLTPEDRHERLNRVNISVLEYGTELHHTHELETPKQLDDYLTTLNEEQVEPEGRLIILQDLSTLMIEKIGAAFDIEPGFFRSHIGDYTWLNTRDPQAEIPGLEAFENENAYFNVSYVQPRYFETPEQLKEALAQTESWNVSRRLDHDGRFKEWADMPGTEVGLVRSKVSLWTRRNKKGQKGWLSIILMDPSITEGFPLWSGYGNFHPPPSIHTPQISISFPPYNSFIQEFLYWTLNQTGSAPHTPPLSPDLLPLQFFVMICSQWILLAEYTNTRLCQVEWEIELGLNSFYSGEFDDTLKTLLMWRKRLPIYHAFITRAIAHIKFRYSPTFPSPSRFASSSSTPESSTWDGILTNLTSLLARIETLHIRADKIMTVAMAVTSREESKKATQESHAITRVSNLAFIFVPLTFLTGFFSMSGDMPTRTYWLYAAIAAPVGLCVIGGLMCASRIGDGVRRWRERVRVWRRDGLGLGRWKGRKDMRKGGKNIWGKV
ncbi:hypothetical protein B7494_g5058 [Chlorociboria aeruginascens]|nr:hypothetical protein B7494_g5058 [Chlorociboria aeruginascens]